MGRLKENFPTLYNLCEIKGVFITDVWDNSMGDGVWNPVFGRNQNDWEMEGVQNVLNLINSRRVK